MSNYNRKRDSAKQWDAYLISDATAGFQAWLDKPEPVRVGLYKRAYSLARELWLKSIGAESLRWKDLKVYHPTAGYKTPDNADMYYYGQLVPLGFEDSYQNYLETSTSKACRFIRLIESKQLNKVREAHASHYGWDGARYGKSKRVIKRDGYGGGHASVEIVSHHRVTDKDNVTLQDRDETKVTLTSLHVNENNRVKLPEK